MGGDREAYWLSNWRHSGMMMSSLWVISHLFLTWLFLLMFSSDFSWQDKQSFLCLQLHSWLFQGPVEIYPKGNSRVFLFKIHFRIMVIMNIKIPLYSVDSQFVFQSQQDIEKRKKIHFFPCMEIEGFEWQEIQYVLFSQSFLLLLFDWLFSLKFQC